MDVDNELDYKEMVRKIHKTVSDPAVTTKISVDMKHVEKLPSRQGNGHSGDEESNAEPAAASDNDQVIGFFVIAEWFLMYAWKVPIISISVGPSHTSCPMAQKAHSEVQESAR